MIKNMKIRSKIISALVVFSLVTFTIILYSIIQMNFLDSIINKLSNNRIPKLVAIYKVSNAVNTIARSTRAMIIYKDNQAIAEQVTQIIEYQRIIEQNLNYLKKTITTDKALLDEIVSLNSNFSKELSRFLSAHNSNDVELRYTILAKDLRETQHGLLKLSDQMMTIQLEVSKTEAEQGVSSSSFSIIIIVASSLTAIILVLIGSILIIRSIVNPILSLEKTVVEISEKGNFNAKIEVNLEAKDELGSFGRSFQRMMMDFRAMRADTDLLTKSTIEGKLNIRADANKYNGDMKSIVEGINRTLDAVVTPLNSAADYVDKISKGEMPPKITDSYNGDFNLLKNNLNACIDNVNTLIEDSIELSSAAIEGQLSKRADAGKHKGDFRKIIEGFNKTLDAITEPMQESASVLDELSNNNLTTCVKGIYKGDHAKIANALNTTIDSISSIIMQIKNASEQMLESSQQLADSSQNLASGSSEQASSTEEVTASLSEIESQAKSNSESSLLASDLSKNVNEKAIKGSEEMNLLLQAMGELNVSSEKISKVVKEIESIAFQTNILALNAAVEAARAGQHGKGFNVVATEVRNLAIRSSNSAKETSLMVEETIKKISASAKLAESNATSLKIIVEGITKLTELVTGVAFSSNEQRLGIQQVNSGINEISKVTMTNSAAAEEMATASDELTGQAKSFTEMVSIFKIKDEKETNLHLQMYEKQKKRIAL